MIVIAVLRRCHYWRPSQLDVCEKQSTYLSFGDLGPQFSPWVQNSPQRITGAYIPNKRSKIMKSKHSRKEFEKPMAFVVLTYASLSEMQVAAIATTETCGELLTAVREMHIGCAAGSSTWMILIFAHVIPIFT